MNGFGKCGARGQHIDVRPNWKEQPARPSLTGKEAQATAVRERRRSSILLALCALLVIVILAILAPTVIFWH